ncbi:DUF4136 domain-containing protein [Shewanella sp. AS16]|uniref:DUF4136 domain-containing protein n=1 Tax=Shewanella sp. AS16 TaxID=2907625 RepID=UPI001F23C0AE|nr:DUF4136 domain-containing protein [Shewanella sp. AS16]MCE9685225.1 DUF4136 domain-containing protein [Shewanella sp. AS16]
MKKLLLAVAVLALSACSSTKTSWDYDPGVNFTQYKTYAWVAKQMDGASYQLDGLMDERVRDAMNAELAMKGFKQVDMANADVLVNYLTKIDKKIDVDTFSSNFGYNPYYGPAWGWGAGMQTQTSVREYEVGTLILDIVDHKTNKLVWRGSLADTVRNKKSPQEKVQIINAAVASIMQNYPPKAAMK